MTPRAPGAGPSRLTRAALFALMTLALLAGGYWYYRAETAHIRQVRHEELAAIGKLKAGQIEQWRKERLADVWRIVNSPLFGKALAEYLVDPDASGLREDLRGRLQIEQAAYGYSDILLLDLKGKILLSVKDDPDPMGPATRQAMAESLAADKPLFSDFYRCPHGDIHLDAVAPIIGADGLPLAVVVMRSNAEDFLYPLIQSWPTPSPSAETMLVRRDGGDVLYLNDLRHQKDTALTLRIPITQTYLPGVQAALGRQGMFEGQDYRGVEVLGDLRPVPGSPWFLVSKVDKSEILAEARYRAVVIAAVVLLFIMLLGAVTAYAYRQRAEAVLRESEQRYRIITENMGDMVWFMDMDFKVTYISPSMFRARGFTLTEFETLPLEKNLSPASMQVVARVLAEELTPERLAQKDLKIERVLELELCRKDGSSFWSEETITLIRDRQGKPSGLVGVGRDITERKRAEAALRESEERHRTIIQTATDGFWLVDMEGRLLEVNESYCRMSGYSERELLAMRIPELEAVEAREDTAAHIQKIMAQGEDRFESRHRRKDGSIFKIETSVQYRPGDGGRLVVFLHDITERKRAEAALRESEERYRSLFENSRDAIMTLEPPSWSFTSGNTATLDMFRAKSEKEFISQSPGNLSPERQPDGRASDEKSREMIETAMRSGSLFFEWTHQRLDGKEFPATVLLSRIEFSGKTFLQATVRDITEQKQLEEQLHQAMKMDAVGRLAGGVAHDFNNQLTVMLSMGGMLLQNPALDDQAREDVTDILEASERAAGLTRQLLAFSRRQAMRLEDVDLGALLANTQKMLRRLIGEDIELTCLAAPDLGIVAADPGQLEQIVFNLAINARDAMPGGGKLTIEAANVELGEESALRHIEIRPGPYVQLTVTDTGEGISPEARSHIFEPFFTTKEKGKGTGMGLAMVYGIVKQSGGDIWVYSEPGRGAVFKLFFPRVMAAVAAAAAEPETAARTAGGHETVLLVEDEENVRELARRILAKAGYRVLEAENGPRALEAAATYGEIVHLLLTDVVMPGMSGRELARRMLDCRPEIKVLFMSGYTDEAMVRHGALEAGTAFIEKPFLPQKLRTKVREALDRPQGAPPPKPGPGPGR